MLTRLPDNTNLKLFYGEAYKDWTVSKTVGPLFEDYLEQIRLTTLRAGYGHKERKGHKRTLAIRCDLRVPQHMGQIDTNIITGFTRSLCSQIKADIDNRNKTRGTKLECEVRYCWVKEQDTSWHWHYHIVIFLNRDVYYTVGDIEADTGNLAARIKSAWARALGMDISMTRGLVHFCGEFSLDFGSSWFDVEVGPFFKAASYLAKSMTKNFGDHSRNFGCSTS